MRVFLFSALLITLLFQSCKVQQTPGEKRLMREKEQAKKELYEKKLIENWNTKRLKSEKEAINKFVTNIIGLKRGDEIEKVFSIYGEPTRHEKDKEFSFYTVYYDYDHKSALSFYYNRVTHKIETIRIKEAAPQFLQQKGVTDTVYVNMHVDEIRKILGYRELDRTNYLRYYNDKVSLEFICYDFHKYYCSECVIDWSFE